MRTPNHLRAGGDPSADDARVAPASGVTPTAHVERDSASLLHDLGEALASMPVSGANVDLTRIVQVVVDVVASQAAPTTQLVVAWPDERMEIEANRSAVPLALFHVLLNAVQAANAVPAGEVTIAFRRTLLGGLFVDVSDNGAGMDAGALGRAFDPFFTRGKNGSATGMGLSLARALLRSVDGDVKLESTPRRGTVARISLGAV